MDCSTPGFPVFHCLLELIQTHVHWVGDTSQPSHPLSSPLPPPIFPSIKVFSNESVLRIRWPKYWSLCFSSPSNEYSGFISFGIDWFDILVVQGTLKSLLQHRSSKALILWCSAFFMVQLLASLVGIYLQWGRPGFDPWVGKIPWRRERLPTPAFWPAKFQGLYNPWGRKESDTTEQLSLNFTHLHTWLLEKP